MKRILPLCLFFFPLVCYTQVQLDWVRKFVGLGLDNAAAIAADNSGNVWICGNNNWGANTADMYTVRYNSSGLQTAGFLYNSPYNFSERAAAVATDPAGNVYVAGKANLNSSTSDIVLIKYSAAAVQQWVVFFNTPQNWIDDVVAMTVDASGNIYMAGSVVKDEPFSYDYLVVKYNTSGVLQWYATYDGTASGVDIANDIAVDVSGNVYVTGLSAGRIKKGRIAISTGYDYVTIKYNSLGQRQWLQRYSASTLNDEAKAIALDASGNVYVTGTYAVASSNLDCNTIKYNNAGQLQWNRVYSGPGGGHDNATDIVVDASGNVFVAGSSSSASGYSDVLALKYNTSGTVQWTGLYDTGPGTADAGKKMGIDIFGNIYITAETSKPGITSSDFLTMKYTTSGVRSWVARYNGPENLSDIPTSMVVVQPPSNFPGAFANANVYVYGTSNNDVITLKYSQPLVIGSASGLEPELQPAQFKVANYPNPVKSYTNISYELPLDSRVTINVFDIAGRKVSTLMDGFKAAGNHVTRFDAGKLPAGTYHYQYTARSANKEFKETKIIVIQR